MPSRYDDLERPPLDEAALRRALVLPGSLWSDVQVVNSTPSTNALLASRVQDAPAGSTRPDGLVVFAEHQTAGRGRLDRVWSAPARSGLAMSVLVRPPDVPPNRWSWIPLLAGLAVAAAVRREARVEAELKWPNDVMVADRKLGGLLVERIEPALGSAVAIIGIGVNVSLRPNELPVPTATSLAIENAWTTDRSLLARAVLRNLEGLLTDWARHGGDAEKGGLHTAYVKACMTIGRRVSVELANAPPVVGTAVGVDSAGHLLVRSQGSQHTFSAGDILHLR